MGESKSLKWTVQIEVDKKAIRQGFEIDEGMIEELLSNDEYGPMPCFLNNDEMINVKFIKEPSPFELIQPKCINLKEAISVMRERFNILKLQLIWRIGTIKKLSNKEDKLVHKKELRRELKEFRVLKKELSLYHDRLKLIEGGNGVTTYKLGNA